MDQESSSAHGEIRNIQLLFLGDGGHHQPSARATQLVQALGPDGFHFTYTEDMSDFNPDYLAQFDGIVHYGNRNEISSAQEKALIDFVESGKGFIPLHAASACFGESSAFINLVGGRFKSHETDTFSAEIVDDGRVIGKDFENFEVWDETYVHDRLNSDMHVIQERVDGDHREPYTWTREQGKGRVFYTAFGHDERAWSNRGFQDLVRRGILWAVGKEVYEAYSLREEPLRIYDIPTPRLPNYEKRPDEPKLQRAFDPSDSMIWQQVPPGFEVQLFASEPDIVNPVAMQWDEKGRLWILETLDYPNNLQPLWEGHDRIRILEDSDGDGKADVFKTFADGLSIPTGFTFADGGVMVSAPPYLLFFKDNDGDDIADEKRVLFEGFNTFDTHAGIANLRYGFDNWIWASIGYAGFNGTVGDEEHVFKQGLLRIKSDGSKMEFLTRFSNNSWGLGFSETGDVFASTANNEPSVYMAIEDRYYKKVSGYDKRGSKKITPYYAMHPITEKVRQVDSFGGYTAAAGHNLYTARSFPKEYWNRMAFVNEPTGHIIHQAAMQQSGSDFVALDKWNLFASADEWSSPIISDVGPDGAVWFLDWYNPIIQHNPVPEGFEEGKGDAYETSHRDQQHGRVYRIVHKSSKATEWKPLSKSDPEGLIKALRSDNMLWRMHAQRLLVERGSMDVVDRLITMVESWQQDEIGVAGAALHALGVLDGLGVIAEGNGKIQERLHSGLSHPSASVVRATLKILGRNADTWEEIKRRNVSTSDDPLVLLDLIKVLSEYEPSEEIGRYLFDLQKNDFVIEDAWLPTAIEIAASVHNKGYLTAAMEDENLLGYYSNERMEIPNGDFELPNGDKPSAWEIETFTWPPAETNPNSFTYSISNEGRSGKALMLSSETGADVSFFTEIDVVPGTQYLFSGWIKTENLENIGGGYGAVFELRGRGRTRAIRGSTDWTWVEREFTTGDEQNTLKIGCHLGRWGQYKGTAWFDDLKIEKLKEKAPANDIIETVVRHLATSGNVAAVSDLIRNVNSAPPIFQILSMEVLADYWPKDLSVGIGAEEFEEIRSAMGETRTRQLLDQIVNGKEESSDDNPLITEIDLQIEGGTLQFVNKELIVQAGEEFILHVNNPDAMPHNVVFGNPGSLKSIGAAADDLLRSGNPPADYVPIGEDILFATSLIEAAGSGSFTFTAPTKPGRYVFVCTYPGHWRTMNGVLVVRG